MTVEGIRERIKEISDLRWDDEAAHAKEDDLYKDVLLAISEGHEAPAMIAREALEAKYIRFTRYCA